MMKTWHLLLVVFLFAACSQSTEVEFKRDGKSLYYNFGGCANCHRTNDQKLVGPGLAGVSKIHTEAWLKKWLKDPKKTWEENDAETQEMRKRLGEEKKSSPGMKLMHPLEDEEVDGLVEFLKTL
ncbi:MAG: cytochrome c [Nitrospinae bacterium]|nr:cytochrome c [Nitrospinota bacterium]